MWSFVLTSFHIVYYFQGLSLLSHISELHFFVIAGKILHCITIIYFVYSLISGWTFGLFPLWAPVNNTVMNIQAQVFVWTNVLFLLGIYIPTIGIAG